MGGEYSSALGMLPLPLGKGLFLLGLGVLMIFGGFNMKWRSSTSDEIIAQWKEKIDKWETLNQGLTTDVSKEVHSTNYDTLTKMMKQLHSLSSNLHDLRTTASNDAFCRTVAAKKLSYNCESVNELIDSTEEKVSNTMKIITEAMDAMDASDAMSTTTPEELERQTTTTASELLSPSSEEENELSVFEGDNIMN